MYIKLLISLLGLALSFTASGAGLGFNPFQKPTSPTSPGGTSQKPPPVTAPVPTSQPSKSTAPVLAPASKPEKQSKK
ncbi:hypothetical protein [Polynucleobacter sp. JS-Polo-80-F4]|uniref:hypothetical protein n=1 Tax=Polynucleobacter sp. JS-Polo-80-F4 TaxID=2576918 RepID=UPI001C0C0735|nr:hypothetical protein [Polynucleobacter sp. JS-Polo-80-F4]MBU3617437.1 hypothetical protein [Polynucleobacter sp. JS-Polo-80-F4]